MRKTFIFFVLIILVFSTLYAEKKNLGKRMSNEAKERSGKISIISTVGTQGVNLKHTDVEKPNAKKKDTIEINNVKSTQGVNLKHTDVEKPKAKKKETIETKNLKSTQGINLKHTDVEKKMGKRKSSPQIHTKKGNIKTSFRDLGKKENSQSISEWTIEDYKAITPENRHNSMLNHTSFNVTGRDQTVYVQVQVDGWYEEASWNVWVSGLGYLWDENLTFSEDYQIQYFTWDFPEGNHSVDCWDSYGDGGIQGYTSGAYDDVSWGAGDYTSFGEFWFEVNGGSTSDPPCFYDVYLVDTVDSNSDGCYEYFSFEIDIDACNGGTAEDVYIHITNSLGDDYGWVGPYDFEGYETSDNVVIGWFDATGIEPQDVTFYFYAENNEGNDSDNITFCAGWPLSSDPPCFWDVYLVDTVDSNSDGCYEYFSFEIDIDACNGGSAEDVYIHIENSLGDDYGWVGPYDFEGYETGDNVVIGPFDATGIEPQDVTFYFYAENNEGNDSYDITFCAGWSTPELYVNPTNIDLGTHLAGYSFSSSFIVNNTGGGTLTGTISESASWITYISHSNFNLTENQQITVTFSGNFPSNPDPFNTNINVNSNAGNEQVYVHGDIEEPDPVLYVNPTNKDLGTHPAGYSFSSSFIVQNTGGGTLTGTISESAFWITSLYPTTFNLTANQQITVNFSGNFTSTPGPFSTNINVNSNAGNDQVYVHGDVENPVANIQVSYIINNEETIIETLDIELDEEIGDLYFSDYDIIYPTSNSREFIMLGQLNNNNLFVSTIIFIESI